jgi:hypothetical protein
VQITRVLWLHTIESAEAGTQPPDRNTQLPGAKQVLPGI